MRSPSSTRARWLGARLSSVGRAVVLFLAVMLAANVAVAHGGAHHAPAVAKADVIAPVPANPDDPGCAHGPLHVFCAAAGTCCVASDDEDADPMTHVVRVAGHWRHSPVAGLEPPPLDRPPR